MAHHQGSLAIATSVGRFCQSAELASATAICLRLSVSIGGLHARAVWSAPRGPGAAVLSVSLAARAAGDALTRLLMRRRTRLAPWCNAYLVFSPLNSLDVSPQGVVTSIRD